LWGCYFFVCSYLFVLLTSTIQYVPAFISTKNDSTIFLLVKFDRKNKTNAVLFNSFFTIQHVQSQYWIRSVALLDRSQHFVVESSPKQNQSEIFRLLPVSMSQISLIEYVQQRLPYLEAYVNALQARTPLSQIKSIQTILIELIQWVQSPSPPVDDPLRAAGKPIHDRQVLLGNSSILVLFLQFLSLPFTDGYNTLSVLQTNSTFRFHCELVYCLLTKIAHRRPTIAIQLYEHMSLFSNQISTCLPVFGLLEEIVNDNREIGSKISANDLYSFIEVSTQSATRSSAFLDFLTKLCICNDQPIPHNQDSICRSLLGRNRFYFFRTRVEETSPSSFKVFSISMDGEVFVRMDNFVWQADRAMIKFYISSLKLFSSLCFGRNTTSITEVRKFVTSHEAFFGLMWSDLPFDLRSAYCDVFLHVYLNSPPNVICRIETVYAVRSARKVPLSSSSEVVQVTESDVDSLQSFVDDGDIVDILEDKEVEMANYSHALSMSCKQNENRQTHTSIVFDDDDDDDDALSLSSTNSSISIGLIVPQSTRRALERVVIRTPQINWDEVVEYLISFIDQSKHPSSFLSTFFFSLLRLMNAILEFGLYRAPRISKVIDRMIEILWINYDEDSPSVDIRPDMAALIEVKVEVCKILETYFVSELRARLSAMANACQMNEFSSQIILETIEAERANISSGAFRNEHLEEVLLNLLRHRNSKLSGFAIRLLVCSRSRQIAAFEAIAHNMKFIRIPQELVMHDLVVTKCLPDIMDACDSLAACDPVRICNSIRKLVEACVTKRKNRIIPNVTNQNLLAYLGVHTAIIKYEIHFMKIYTHLTSFL
jgi:hypothetical protein